MKILVGIILVLFATIACSPAQAEVSLQLTAAERLPVSTFCTDGKGKTIQRTLPPLPPGYACDSRFGLTGDEELLLSETGELVNAIVRNGSGIVDSKITRVGFFTINATGTKININTSGQVIEISIDTPPKPAGTPTSVAATPVSQTWASTDINKEKVIWSPTADKPYQITVKGLPALENTLSRGFTGKHLILHGEVAAQALHDWGLRGKITPVHYEWVGMELMKWSCQQDTYACTNFKHPGAEFSVYLSRGALGLDPFDNDVDLYNSIIQGETYRLIMLKVPGKLSTSVDGLNSQWWKEWGNKPSPYKFITSE